MWKGCQEAGPHRWHPTEYRIPEDLPKDGELPRSQQPIKHLFCCLLFSHTSNSSSSISFLGWSGIIMHIHKAFSPYPLFKGSERVKKWRAYWEVTPKCLNAARSCSYLQNFFATGILVVCGVCNVVLLNSWYSRIYDRFCSHFLALSSYRDSFLWHCMERHDLVIYIFFVRNDEVKLIFWF